MEFFLPFKHSAKCTCCQKDRYYGGKANYRRHGQPQDFIIENMSFKECQNNNPQNKCHQHGPKNST